MTQRSDGTWEQAITEPLWVRPRYLVGPSKPFCCGVTFRTRERYEEHYRVKHFTKPIPFMRAAFSTRTKESNYDS